MKKSLIWLVCLIMWINGFTTTYFISNSGSTSNNGTSAGTPWPFSKVNSTTFAANDLIQFNRGETFVGTIAIQRNNLNFGTYGSGAKPIITGWFTVPAWTNLGSNIWESTNAVSTLVNVNMVAINGVNTAMGRTPNYPTYYTYQSRGGTFGTTSTTITSSNLNSSITNWASPVGAEVVIWNATYTTIRHPVTSQSGTILGYNSQPVGENYQDLPFNSYFFLQNDIRTLDVQNEWYYNPTTKKIRIWSTSQPTNVQVATIQNLVVTNAHTFLTFDNISFSGSNANAIQILTTLNNASTHVAVTNCDFNFIGEDVVTNTSSGAGSLKFDHCYINNCNNYGLKLRGNPNDTVTNCTIKNIGMLIGMGPYPNLANPLFDGAPGVLGNGIDANGAGNIISHNRIDSVGQLAIRFGGNGSIISYNYVSHATFANGTSDGGAIYSINSPPGSWVLNNIIVSEGNGGEGIYCDDLANGINIIGNTIEGCGSGFQLHSSYNMVVRDNTSYNSSFGEMLLLIQENPPAGSNISMHNNIFFPRDNLINNDNWTMLVYTVGTAQMPAPFSSDSNYFCRPINPTNHLISLFTNPGGFSNLTLPMWRAINNSDAHSQTAPATITNTNQIFFCYNPTDHDSTIALPFSGVDAKNVFYSGSVLLHTFQSLVLISTGSQTTPTITWANPAPITYPTPLSGTQLNATASTAGTFTYTPASGTVLNAGASQTLHVLFTPTNTTLFTSATKDVLITVNKATATLTYSNLTQTYTGSPLSPTVTTSPAGLTVINTTYNGVSTVPTNAGTYTVVSGLTNTNYQATPITSTFTINKATATINISNLNQVYNGSPKPISVATVPAGLSGIAVTYNGSSTVPTNAGSYNLVVSLTNTNYTATNVLGTLVIAKGTPVITWANPAAITYPAPLSGTQLNATSSVAGTFVYTPPSGTVLNAGTQVLSVNFTPTDAANWNSVNNTTVSLVVNKGTATIALSNLNQTYDGTPKSAIATTTPAGLTVVTVTYNGSSTAPTNAGSYAVVASLANANYNATNASGTLVIAKATATISVSNLAQTYNGSPKSVTTSTVPAGLTVISITYNGSATPPTNAGSYAVVVTLSNTNYQAAPVNTTLVIAKATPVITWGNPVAITYGTPLSGTQLNATSSVAGSFVYTPPSGTILSAGSHSLVADFTPTDGTNYNSVNGTTVTITVNKATATITLGNLNQIYSGSPLSISTTTSPVGLGVISVTYDGSATPPTNAGSYAVVATLTNPNYNASPASGTFVIAKATATITLSNLAATYDGTQKSVTATTSPAGLTVVSITYNGSATPPTNAGTYPIVASLVNANYQATNATGNLVISKATPVISWSNPGAITYPTPLSGTQLNATSGGVSGTFVYTPPSGTVLNAGTQTLTVNFTPTDAANYNSVNGTSVSIVVNKATATITLSNLNQDFDGNPKPVTVSVSPSVGVITVTYDGSATVPSAIGTYAVVATLTNTNYTATPGTGNLVISSSVANITITNVSQTYTGTPRPVTVTTIPSGLPHVDTYNGSSTVPTNVGSYVVIATINDGGVHTGADTATLVINKANPIITWSNPAAITYGTALSGTQLNASANVPGVFTYTPASGTVLNAGTQTLSVGFVPTDGANYNSIPVTTVSLVVNKAVATITLSNLNQTFDGNPKPVTVTTSPVGLSVITVLYDDDPAVPSAVGSYGVAASLANANYTATPALGTLVISMATATVTITNLIQTYTGSPLPVTVTTNPSGLPTTVSYNGSATVPTNAGTYAVVATINDGIHSGSNSATLQINKATPTVTWANPTAITYPAPLTGTQLNATASVAGTFTYTPVSGTILSAGTQTLSVNFTPTDATNYNSVTGTTVTIVVNKATATLTLSNLAQAFDGNPKPVTVTTSPVGLTVIGVTYDGSSTVPSAVGSYAVVATLNNSNYNAAPASGTLVISTTPAGIAISNLNQTYTGGNISVTVTTNPVGLSHTVTYNGSATLPVNVGTYTVIATINDGIHTGADTQTLSIVKATPVITWPNPASITYGTALSGTQLNATVNVPGGLTYNPVSGTILNVGTQNLSVSFIPTDGANYNAVNKIVPITVTQLSATLTLSNLSQVYDGTPKPVIVTSSPAGLSGITVLYNGSSTVPTNAGSYAIVATLVNDNYQATPVTGTLVVAKATAVLSWVKPASVTVGATLNSTQLNATASIAGTFVYNPASGTLLLAPGIFGLSAIFTPTDSVNYNGGTVNTSITVVGDTGIDFWIDHGGGTYFKEE